MQCCKNLLNISIWMVFKTPANVIVTSWTNRQQTDKVQRKLTIKPSSRRNLILKCIHNYCLSLIVHIVDHSLKPFSLQFSWIKDRLGSLTMPSAHSSLHCLIYLYQWNNINHENYPSWLIVLFNNICCYTHWPSLRRILIKSLFVMSLDKFNQPAYNWNLHAWLDSVPGFLGYGNKSPFKQI